MPLMGRGSSKGGLTRDNAGFRVTIRPRFERVPRHHPTALIPKPLKKTQPCNFSAYQFPDGAEQPTWGILVLRLADESPVALRPALTES